MEQSFSKDTMLASLRDIRLPDTAAGGALADVMVSIGLAALAAMLCIAILRLFFRPRCNASGVTLERRVHDAFALSEADRRVALLHILKQYAPERYKALSGGLYAPGQLDMAQLEAEIARLV